MCECVLYVYTSLVEEVESTGDLCGVESGMFLGEPAMSLHVEHEVPSIHTLYHKEQSGDVSEREGGER